MHKQRPHEWEKENRSTKQDYQILYAKLDVQGLRKQEG